MTDSETSLAITKNGLTRLSAPPKPDLASFKTEKKITDEEVLKILEQPLAKATGGKSKSKKKRKKPVKKPAAKEEEEEEEDDDDEDSDDE